MTTSADPRSSQWLGHIATWALTYLVVAGSLKGFLCLLLIVLSGLNDGTVRLFVLTDTAQSSNFNRNLTRIRTAIDVTVYLRNIRILFFDKAGHRARAKIWCLGTRLSVE